MLSQDLQVFEQLIRDELLQQDEHLLQDLDPDIEIKKQCLEWNEEVLQTVSQPQQINLFRTPNNSSEAITISSTEEMFDDTAPNDDAPATAAVTSTPTDELTIEQFLKELKEVK